MYLEFLLRLPGLGNPGGGVGSPRGLGGGLGGLGYSEGHFVALACLRKESIIFRKKLLGVILVLVTF